MFHSMLSFHGADFNYRHGNGWERSSFTVKVYIYEAKLRELKLLSFDDILGYIYIYIYISHFWGILAL